MTLLQLPSYTSFAFGKLIFVVKARDRDREREREREREKEKGKVCEGVARLNLSG